MSSLYILMICLISISAFSYRGSEKQGIWPSLRFICPANCSNLSCQLLEWTKNQYSMSLLPIFKRERGFSFSLLTSQTLKILLSDIWNLSPNFASFESLAQNLFVAFIKYNHIFRSRPQSDHSLAIVWPTQTHWWFLKWPHWWSGPSWWKRICNV